MNERGWSVGRASDFELFDQLFLARGQSVRLVHQGPVRLFFSFLSEQAFTALFFFLHVVLLLHPEPERFLEQQLLAFSSLLGICVAAGYAASRIAGW